MAYFSLRGESLALVGGCAFWHVDVLMGKYHFKALDSGGTPGHTRARTHYK